MRIFIGAVSAALSQKHVIDDERSPRESALTHPRARPPNDPSERSNPLTVLLARHPTRRRHADRRRARAPVRAGAVRRSRPSTGRRVPVADKARRAVTARAADSVEVSTDGLAQTRESRKEGRPIYSPDSYQDICYHVYQSVADGLADGLDLMEVEFPAVPGEDASYKAASDVYIDLNIQYALTVFSKIYKETGKTCEVLVPDGPSIDAPRRSSPTPSSSPTGAPSTPSTAERRRT